MAEFEGFPKETFAFLKGLAQHNDGAWFYEHREAYEEFVIAPEPKPRLLFTQLVDLRKEHLLPLLRIH